MYPDPWTKLLTQWLHGYCTFSSFADLSYCHCIYCAYKCVCVCVCVCFGVPTSHGLTHQTFLPKEDTEERSVSFPPLPWAPSRATDAFYFSICYLKLWLAWGMGRAVYGRPHGLKKWSQRKSVLTTCYTIFSPWSWHPPPPTPHTHKKIWSFIENICIFKCCFLLKLFSDSFYVLETTGIYYIPLIKANNQSAHMGCNQSHHSPLRFLGGMYSKCNR